MNCVVFEQPFSNLKTHNINYQPFELCHFFQKKDEGEEIENEDPFHLGM